MKKVFVMMVMLCVLLASVGCAKKTESGGPKTAISGFLDGIIASDYKKAAEYAEDASELPSEEDVDPIATEIFSKISYEITDVKEDGDKATVKLKVKHPDFNNIMEIAQSKMMELTAKALESAADSEEKDPEAQQEEITKMVTDLLTEEMGKEENIKETEAELIAVKIDGKWKVSKESKTESLFGL
ncbi:hypothetical protein HZI73_13775 [Vallitalea pronyensis]|uniref:DUF5105 domain-containing protein n=1 Tax=Vallitalea pronyensis TaxID=1348613 RepID=A0A8J8SGZ1_9FIRM|nr:hypothetical protein [Vallitalea pronyensis]QUI23290.1 hypothetical protein HZI73_13775 [Vallitalea pronyensis]